jgi:hypothetical protein
MGMERLVTFSGAEPSWSSIRARLAAAGSTPQMRMIDNMPAFPDEEPEGSWTELRVSLGGGMVTLRREPGRIRVVVWGNADAGLQRDQETVAQACSDAGGGKVT